MGAEIITVFNRFDKALISLSASFSTVICAPVRIASAVLRFL